MMKGRSIFLLVLILAIAAGLSALSYFGIGSEHTLGIQNIRQGLDLKGGVSILYEAGVENPSDADMRAALQLIQRRLDARNYTEAQVGKQGNRQIRVDIPDVDDAEKAVSEVGKTALLSFRDEGGNILLTGTDVVKAEKAMYSQTQGVAAEIVVSLEFNADGTKKFADATGANVGKPLYIYLDEEMISAPNVNTAITDGKAIITGQFTAEYAEYLATTIREGSLPFALNVISMNNVGALLGADALRTSITAGIIGSLLVLLFMAIVYRVPGICADLALVLYIGIVLVFLSLFKINLTLPGIAGIILSIGMAVDANVIIFERMREEIKSGRTLRTAIGAGFSRAFPAILDSNVTTLIAAVVLYWLGTGPVKGFAQTLAIGIIVSMFTALVITKFIITNVVGAGVINTKFFFKKAKEN